MAENNNGTRNGALSAVKEYNSLVVFISFIAAIVGVGLAIVNPINQQVQALQKNIERMESHSKEILKEHIMSGHPTGTAERAQLREKFSEVETQFRAAREYFQTLNEMNRERITVEGQRRKEMTDELILRIQREIEWRDKVVQEQIKVLHGMMGK